jgi:C4-dicarboxylate transporter DctQ subunit
VKLFPRFWQRMIGLFAVLLCLIYCTMFIMGSWEYLNLLYMIGITLEDLPVPKWLAFSVLLIGFVLLAMRLLVVGWRIATNQSCGFKLADEARESMHLIHKEEEHDAYQGRECPVDTEEKPRGDVK